MVLVATCIALASCASDRSAPGDGASGAWRVAAVGDDGGRRSTRVLLPTTGSQSESLFRTETPVVSAPRPFVGLLPSWNVTLGADEYVVVEVRVRHADDGSWSPWLFVGAWGATPIEELPPFEEPRPSYVTRYERGRVATDWLVLDEPATQAQLRFEMGGRANAFRPTTIERVALCFEHGAEFSTPIPDVAALAAVEVDVPFFSQRAQRDDIAPRICSPTSLTMVLASHGIELPVETVARRAYDPRHDIYGNWPRNVQAAWSFGLPGYVTRFDHWGEVAEHFASGRALVASIGVEPGQLTGAPYDRTSGHLIVMRGFDVDGNVLVNDPAGEDAATGRVTYLREELDVVWLARGGTAYVIAPSLD